MSSTRRLVRWLPALVMMAVIFAFSSIPSAEMPDFDWADFLVKKGGHMLGYGLLGIALLYGLERGGSVRRELFFLAWLLAVLYAVSDEFHQSFVPGRNPSALDVGIDALGAAIGLGGLLWWRNRKRE